MTWRLPLLLLFVLVALFSSAGCENTFQGFRDDLADLTQATAEHVDDFSDDLRDW